jgi:hypothetical protein
VQPQGTVINDFVPDHLPAVAEPLPAGRSVTPPPLAHRVPADANAAQIAEAVVATCQEIDAALAPIIGQRGVAALYRRSLHLASALHPWLAATPEGFDAALGLGPLKTAFAQQSSADAVAASSALFRTFHELLGSLVGPSLTERLLRAVWTHPISAPPAQDMSP